MPPILSRFAGFSTLVPGPWTGVSEEDVREAFQKQIWFDIAGFAFPGQIRGLLDAGVKSDRLFYGSDYPFTRADGVEYLLNQMDKGVQEIFGAEETENVYHSNAERLLNRSKVR